MPTDATLEQLQDVARLIRRDVVSTVGRLRVGYLLQGLGAADLFAALYFSELTLDPRDPRWPQRDRCLLSTAHNTAVFYATLARRGMIPANALESYTQDGSVFEVNASERVGPVVEATCGSLGQGLSVGVGMALSLRRHGSRSRVYVILGDGELQEGQVWEAVLSAGGFGLDNLCLVIDRNYLQVEGHTDKVLAMDPIAPKFAAFGWHAIDANGNDLQSLLDALGEARGTWGRPTVIVARTLPGAGVPFLEGQLAHIAFISPQDTARALEHLAGPT